MMHLHVCITQAWCTLTEVCGAQVTLRESVSCYLEDLLKAPKDYLADVTCPACLVRADEILEKGKL